MRFRQDSSVPPPDLGDLGRDLTRLYLWLADLDDDERAVAKGRLQDRSLVVSLEERASLHS